MDIDDVPPLVDENDEEPTDETSAEGRVNKNENNDVGDDDGFVLVKRKKESKKRKRLKARRAKDAARKEKREKKQQETEPTSNENETKVSSAQKSKTKSQKRKSTDTKIAEPSTEDGTVEMTSETNEMSLEEALAEAQRAVENKDNKMDVDADEAVSDKKRRKFAPISAEKLASQDGAGYRRVAVPQHRYTPLKENWLKIVQPIVQQLKLQIRFNLKSRHVELKTTPKTDDVGALQRASDFIKAFTLGFDVEDALALLRLEDLYIQSFNIQDVKPLKGDHLGRAIGRLAGKNGRTKYTIENVTKTRIILADSNIHLLGSFQNIQVAKRAICNLILGSPPSKIYGTLKTVAERITARF